MKSMKMIQRAQRGFTLIELMIVVAIIGILAAVAIPQYQDYVIRAKLANAAAAAEPLKLSVADWYQQNGAYPAATDITNSIPAFSATKEVSAATITAGTGVIVVTLQNIKATDIDGKKITYTPAPGATNMKWQATTDITTPVAAKAYVDTKLNGS